MALTDETLRPVPSAPERTVSTLEAQLTRLLYVDAEVLAYMVIFILAVVTRFWDLGARAMSHDESLHVRYSWNLYKGQGFQHTPLMHGPLLFHMTALSYLLFGDNDFTGRIYAALVGIIVVMLPIFFRRWLGRTGAIATSFLLLISPMIMYYSRYIREDMPAILGALLMVLGIWHYMEKRENKYLLILTFGFAILYSQKEVSFIYVAIFGSFMTLYWILRLLDVEWKNRALFRLFVAGLMLLLLGASVFGALTIMERGGQAEIATGEVAAASPSLCVPTASLHPLDIAKYAGLGIGGLGLLLVIVSILTGQWLNLRRFPELDVAIVMGTLILPMLSPFVIHTLCRNPMDESPAGIQFSFAITLPIIIASVLIGLFWGITPPKKRIVQMPIYPTGDNIDSNAPPQMEEVEVEPDLLDWIQALLSSRWWAIGLIFWLWFFFFFTTMFTNGAGIGTGIIGSLGYWLEQQEVKRGNQPNYYYLLIAPMYEFLPLILSFVAAPLGLIRLLRWEPPVKEIQAVVEEPAPTDEDSEIVPTRRRPFIDLDTPIRFPVFLFAAYWAVMNFAAYSIAGEKMPWLTTHLTIPLIFIGGWTLGQLIDSIRWRKLMQNRAWVVVILLPILAIALLRAAGPICNRIALPVPVPQAGIVAGEQVTVGEAILGALRLPCNTIIPERYQQGVLGSPSLPDLYATYTWLAALIVLAGVVAGLIVFGRRIPFHQIVRLSALWIVAYLVFLTARIALIASFINYDLATEYMVYAHSSGAVKEVMAQIDEISLKTTDGYGLRVAYDNKVSWPYSWYFRNYYNAVYYGDSPSRGLIGDAPVILAGPDNWTNVEAIIGDRYYHFEYIRMWWPMQDYFDMTDDEIKTFLVDPQMQRGIWNIFMYKDYAKYAEAVTKYRASTPNFELSEWPVAERMRVYIRKDVFAEVWDYGVTASEIAAATDPYAEGVRQLAPINNYGIGLLARPHGGSRGPDGLLYVADSANHRIVVFDEQGTVVRTMGSFGIAPEENVLNEPWDVAVSADGNVYIADTWNHRVVQYDAEGEFVRTWGHEGPNQNDSYSFWGPRGIAVDRQGNVYVADTGNKRITVFDGEGNYLRQIGSGGLLDGQVDEPSGLAFGPDGLLYVADTWNQRIDVFTREGSFVRQWPVDAWYAQSNERPYIAVDEAGRVYITDPDAFRVIVFNSTGQYLFSFGDFNLIGLAGGVVEGEEGNLYVIDTANGSVQHYQVESAAP